MGQAGEKNQFGEKHSCVDNREQYAAMEGGLENWRLEVNELENEGRRKPGHPYMPLLIAIGR